MAIEIRCQSCGHFLCEVDGSARVRAYCKSCGSSTTWEPPRVQPSQDWRGYTRA